MKSPPIPYSRQVIDDDDIEAVVSVLRSDWLTQGPAIENFENAVKQYCGTEHAVAVASATAGLHLACMVLGIQQGDRVWTSPISFVASANCARYVGAQVDFVDIDPQTGNMSIDALEVKLRDAKANGTLPKVIIPVHYAGRSCDMERLATLKAEYGFMMIEDAAHALGARYADSSPVGGFAHSELIVFSFHPVKPVTTGEGGVIVTRSELLAERLRLLRSHGITRDRRRLHDVQKPDWYYEQQELGFHYRLTDMQAALGASQMRKLDQFIARRKQIAARYSDLLAALPVRLPPYSEVCGWHLYVIQMEETLRDNVFNAMRNEDIHVNLHYWPIHLQPYYRSLGFREGVYPEAERFAHKALSLPVHPRLTEEEQSRVVNTLRLAISA